MDPRADDDLLTADFQFDLPEGAIAAHPPARRDASRLMCLPRLDGAPTDHRFTDLPNLLQPGDLLVLNDTRVFPARIGAHKPRTGGRLELLLIEEREPHTWLTMVKGRIKAGEAITLDGGMDGEVTATHGDGTVTCRFPGEDVAAHLERHGEIPLPPYIHRPADAGDRERYQTVFAARTGSVAAPTSGLHFTPAVLAALDDRGVERAHVTLHVGPGTFLPVRTERIAEHRMHGERFEVSEATAAAIERTRTRGGRVIACGTTVTRTLESAATENGRVAPARGSSALFIRPGYRFRVVDGLVTNFHLPGSTLLMLVSALAGRERVLNAYREAVERGYRFFSYGDAMLIR